MDSNRSILYFNLYKINCKRLIKDILKRHQLKHVQIEIILIKLAKKEEYLDFDTMN